MWMLFLGIGMIIFALILFSLDRIIALLFSIFNLLGACVFATIRHFTIDKPLLKSKYYENLQLQERIVQAEKEQKHKEQILQQQNKILKACLNKVRELRIKYPYADESLFQYYMKRFPSAPVDELTSIENQIMSSHLANDMNYSNNVVEQKSYTLADINGLSPLEEHREDPVIMRIYKIGPDYLLHIKNVDLNSDFLCQSRDYLVVARVITKVIEQQKELHKLKQDIKSEDIESIYNSVNQSTRSFRRNKMDFLD